MAIAFGLTTFGTISGAIGVVAAFGPIGPFVAAGIVVKFLSVVPKNTF
jgi:hypothetical protein